MSEFRSKCCGAKVYIWVMVFYYFCAECHHVCEVVAKEKEAE